MNAGGTFQDLLNLDTTQEDIQSVINDLKTLEQEVNDNTDAIAINQNNIFDNTGAIFTNEGKITQNTSFININSNSISSIINIQNQHSIDIQFNSSAIATNTNNITTNTNNIISNISNITTNTNNIASNISNIATNTNNISTLNNTVLLKDGSIPLDVSYNPINNQDVATKDYVDTHNTSNAYLRVDGTNSMTGNLSLSGHLLRLDSLNSMYVAGGNIAAYAHSGIIFYISNNNIMAISASQIEMLKNLNLLNNNIFNVNDIFLNNINNVNFNNLVADVNSNNSNIASNLGLINTNISDISSNLGLITNNTNNINNNDTDITNLDNNKLSKSGGVMTGSLNMNSNFISNCLYITSYGDITVLNDRYVKCNLFEPVSGNIIYMPGSNGMGMAFIQSNFGTNALNVQSNLNLLTNDISNVGLINGYDLQTLNDGINDNISNIASNLVLINNNTTAINNNDTDITNLDNNKLSNSGGLMTGDIDMNYNDLKYCNDILATSLTSNGVLQPLTIKTTQLVVDAEDLGDCELLLKADASNIDEGNNPRIAFQQDGVYKEAAIFLGDNELNISSSAGGAGINFRCGTTNNGWLTAPIRMSIAPAGDVTVYYNQILKTTNYIELGNGTTKETNAGRIAYKRYSTSVDMIGAGTTGGGDRQFKMWEDLTLKQVTQTSDERLKTNIRPIGIAMAGSLIDSLQPKCYMWKAIDEMTGEDTEFKDHHCYMGLIAQEVKTTQDAIGNAMGEKLRISRNAKTEKEYMSVCYTQLIAPMMKCIQDLRSRVFELENKINIK